MSHVAFDVVFFQIVIDLILSVATSLHLDFQKAYNLEIVSLNLMRNSIVEIVLTYSVFSVEVVHLNLLLHQHLIVLERWVVAPVPHNVFQVVAELLLEQYSVLEVILVS